MSDPNWPQPENARPRDEEPRSQPFQPMSYDLAPEYGPPPQPDPYAQPYQQPYQQPQPPQQPYQQQQPYQAPQVGYPVSAPPQGGYPVSTPPQAYPGYPGYGPVVAAAPPRKHRGLKITLSILGALFLVCGIIGCVVLAPIISQSGAHVTAPDTLPGGLTRETSQQMQSVVDNMKASLKKDVSANDVAAGIYSEDADPTKLVILVAATATIFFPGTQINEAFNGFTQGANDPNLKVSAKKDYPAGKLGGNLKCAIADSETVKMTMCAWADYGSVGIGIFIVRDEDASAAQFKQIREAVQTR